MGSDIRRPLADQKFANIITDLQKQGWLTFKDVMRKFFGNCPDYKNIGRTMLVFSGLELSHELKDTFSSISLALFF